VGDPVRILPGGALPGIDRFWPQGCSVPRIQFCFDKPLAFVRAVETHIPKDRPGVYVFCDETGRPIYVGKAICLRKRLLSYARGAEDHAAAEPLLKESKILRESRGTVIGPCLDELGALVWERELISTWKPRWNRSHNLPLRRWLWLIRKQPAGLTGKRKSPMAAGVLDGGRRFQMKANRPADLTEFWGPFRGGRWTTALKGALNAVIPGLSRSDHESMALSFLEGKDRTFLRTWERHVGRICEAKGVVVAASEEVRGGEKPGPLEQFQALLSFEKWRVHVTRSKALTGYCPIASLGSRSWNCAPAPGLAYFYFLQEGRLLTTMQAPRHHQSLPAALPGEFFVSGGGASPGFDEPMLVSQWLDRFPACAQSFVFAQTTRFSNSAGSA